MSLAVPRITAHNLAPSWTVLPAPALWQCVDFISDLHLQASQSATFCAWQDYMQRTRADAVFILGDLFELWIGDDVMTDGADVAVINDAGLAGATDQAAGFEARCAQVLKAASRRLAIFFMHGNRDFLLGPAFAKTCGMTLLDDPTLLDFNGQRWLLSHGDALCMADVDYMQFRTLVRGAPWQQNFLAQTLAQRRVLARALRTQSEARKRSGLAYADLDAQASGDWLRAAQANTLIHGHTHQPANHDLANGLRRIVLSDWDASATPVRAEVLRLSATLHNQSRGSTVHRIAATLA